MQPSKKTAEDYPGAQACSLLPNFSCAGLPHFSCAGAILTFQEIAFVPVPDITGYQPTPHISDERGRASTNRSSGPALLRWAAPPWLTQLAPAKPSGRPRFLSETKRRERG